MEGLIGSGDELVILWRRMLPRVSSILLFRGYGIVDVLRYILSRPTKAHLHYDLATLLASFGGRVMILERRLSRAPEGNAAAD